MAELGVEAISSSSKTGEAPETTEGLDFFNTGVALVTDQPHDGVEAIDHRRGEGDLLGLTRPLPQVPLGVGRVGAAARQPIPRSSTRPSQSRTTEYT